MSVRVCMIKCVCMYASVLVFSESLCVYVFENVCLRVFVCVSLYMSV